MSILYMEGFEDVASPADLAARGESGNASEYTEVDAARYLGGKSLARTAYATGYLLDRPLPRLTDNGLNLSVNTKLISSGTATGLANQVNRGPNGEYVGGSYAFSGRPNAIQVSLDGKNWKTETVTVMTGYTNFPMGIAAAVWHPGINAWIAVGSTTTSGGCVIGKSPDLLGPYRTNTFSQGTTLTQNTISLYYDAGANLVYGISKFATFRYNPGSETSPGSVTNASTGFSTNNVYPVIATDGTAWYTASNSLLFKTTDINVNFTTTNVLATNSVGVAAGNGVLVSFTRSYNINAQYSTDQGVTWTRIFLPGVADVPSHTWVSFFKGKFWATNSTIVNKVFSSVDAVTWEVHDTNIDLPSPGNYPFAPTDTYMCLATDPRVYWTEDGINYNTEPNGYVENANFGTTPVVGFLPVNRSGQQFGVRVGKVNDTPALNVMLPTGTTSYIEPTVNVQYDKWALLELSVGRSASNTLRLDVSYDGMPVLSNEVSFSSAFFPAGGSIPNFATAARYYVPGATNGATVVYVHRNSNGVTSTSRRDLGGPYTPESVPAVGNGMNMLWTGKRFIMMGTTGIAISWDGSQGSWNVVLQSSIGALRPADSNGDTVIVSAWQEPNGGKYYRSADGGETWSELAITGWNPNLRLYGMFYVNNTWIAIPATTVAAPEGGPWYYSIDDGLNWVSADVVDSNSEPLYITNQGITSYFTKVGSKLLTRLISSTSRYFYIEADGGVITATEFDDPSAATVAGQSQVAYNGRYLAFSSTNNTTTYLLNTENQELITTSTSAANADGLLAVNGAFVRGTSNATTGFISFIYPEWFDCPIDVVLDGRSFSHFDDLVVNDNAAPHVGALGEARILKVPLDANVQSQWIPNPNTMTNVAAATQQPVSTATAFVESNEVGQKDIYGTSSFAVPQGYRAAAVQVDGHYERTLNSVPSAKLGVRVGTDEDTTPTVYVSAPVGTKVYTSKVINSSPGGTPWTSQTIAEAEVTNERVG